MRSLSNRSQVASSAFRDFEAEYPSLVIEFSSNNDEATIAVRGGLLSHSFSEFHWQREQTTLDESTFQPSQGDMSGQARSAKDVPNDNPAQDYGYASSSMTKSTGYDWNEELYWGNQVVDTDYVSQLQTPSTFGVGGQSSLRPPNSWQYT